MPPSRQCPFGCELLDDLVHARVWAPKHRSVELVLEGGAGGRSRPVPLMAEENGWFSGLIDGAAHGSLYRFRLDDDPTLLPDPASRFQPRGPHGPSQIIDPSFPWTDTEWPGVRLQGQVVYEMHFGTFTPEGTFLAAIDRLPLLVDIGVSLLELMPVAEFPGRFGWGYDGVDLFAPFHRYGKPNDLRAFVDRAHSLGLGVILDVVYNHLGPDGNYLTRFSEDFFTSRYQNEWGEALNFDGPGSGPVRQFFAANAAHWISEYHLDGLRLDATQSMHDSSPDHILSLLEKTCRRAAGKRKILLISENEPQDCRLLRGRDAGGLALDASWNDDFHHSAMVSLLGRNPAYYTDHHGSPQEFVSAVRRGYLFQGQRYAWQRKRRGTPSSGLSPSRFVIYLQNHDQIANSDTGRRVHQLAHPGRVRALTALTLLAPSTPMLFQGQEFGASSPFLYFADHTPELAARVREGRVQFLAQFDNIAADDVRPRLPVPDAESTFKACKLDWSERDRHGSFVALHRDLLRLRRTMPVLASQPSVDGAVLGAHAFVLRWFGSSRDDLILLVNLGPDVREPSIPEPLLAPTEGSRWKLIWSSEHPDYGGAGTPSPDTENGWVIPGESALLLGCHAHEEKR